MSTQIALTIAAIASGLLAGFFLASGIVVNIFLSGGSGDVKRAALRTALTTGILGGIAALATLGGIVNHLNAPDSMNVIGPALVGLILVIVGAALGIVFGGNTRHEANPMQILGWRRANWGGLGVSAAAFILILAALNSAV